MKVVTTAQMRELDRRTIEEFDVSGEVLMDRAGAGVAETVRFLARAAGMDRPSALLIAGRGNNGGDAFVAARHLAAAGLEVETWLAGEAAEVRGDALRHLSRMKSAGVTLRELPTADEWDRALDSLRDVDIVVDGVLGTGISGPARGPAAGAIQYINALAEESLVVSIDIPSGLNSDTGEAPGGAVTADVTATMGLPKTGLLAPAALDRVGNVEVVDIGLPWELTDAVECELELITSQDLRGIVPRRARSAHKGLFGHVLVVAGAPGFAGAAALACRAASRSGAGLVSALTPAGIAAVVAGLAPEAMVHAGAATAEGNLAAGALEAWGRDLSAFSAVLVGPGLTAHPDTLGLLKFLLARCACPLVVDADALNVCDGQPQILADAAGPVVATPHPGEMGRLLGCPAAGVQGDRIGAARRAAAVTGAYIVLKGAGTVVTGAQGRPHVNLCGNPGMATGGTGDVLAGLLAGLLAQGIAPFDAARLAVYLHARAGDDAAWRGSQAGLIASDIVAELPHALRDILAR
ncbi:MAG: NAD(P)H-hydrate dehydratase [Lentisphaerae bacterium]|nr:NAD(P)H-hydrate dehydratase [Lentisphaerota bacterium]